ncbi:VgrG-related protein [Roseofilum casamattae]|uniref:VgrG-related protein n=1 Tax=Roseofilum casamattae BLCC-M143 TaxID=3022442 RepID=A0ABT7C0G9_9CYAN|nr:VgrG-related protein [Roseofilum casamattae]MDJ1184944.1 VgrG-related protein [Roseofilum casamattae BLCC-M143]
MANNTLLVSTPLVEIEGATQDEISKFMRDILQISVEESLHLPSMFTLVVNNPYSPLDEETETWQHDRLIQIGKKVRIGFIESTAQESETASQDYLIDGEITGIETHFTNTTQAPIVIRGYDLSHRFHRGRYNRSFQDYTDSDIVKKVAREMGITAGQVDDSRKTHQYVFQENQTNMEFLRERAARIGFELFIQDGQLHFRKPMENEVLQLAWLTDVENFRVRVTSSEKVDSVEVRSWDYQHKKPIVARVENHDLITNVEGKGEGIIDTSDRNDASLLFIDSNFGSNLPSPKLIVVDKPVASPDEADVMAQAIYDELGGEFIYADAQANGNPLIRVGKVVELTQMGRYSGKYYVTETRHLYYQGIYTTEFSVRGTRGGSIFDVLSPNNRLRPGQTLMVGIVTHNRDPEGLGRVRVKFPTLNPEPDGSAHASQWARVVGVGAGQHRGFDCLPEINDEVLVAFEHGDVHRPYVIGGLWNGKDKPPERVNETISAGGKVRLRTFKTPTGHMLQFVEEDRYGSQDGVYLRTSGGHELRLNDSDRSLEISTTGNNRIRFDDRNQRIEIHTRGGQQYILDDARQNVTMKSNGSINLNSARGVQVNPGVGQMSVSGHLSSQTLTTGQLIVGLGANQVNVGEAIAGLQQQVNRQQQQFQTYVQDQQTLDQQQDAARQALAQKLQQAQNQATQLTQTQQQLLQQQQVQQAIDQQQNLALQQAQNQLQNLTNPLSQLATPSPNPSPTPAPAPTPTPTPTPAP